ncbi:MAG: helix-turn-helix domain-containing protein [Alteromonadaceae bacterium]|nr:helix-turn-helix domain-containing protein [Alteromonadaceae bacterium]
MTDPNTMDGRATRLTEAIENGPLKAHEIASLLSASRTSVLNWKKRGAITVDNLKGLADITGYRYWWLAFGEGPKRSKDDTAPCQHAISSDHVATASNEHAALIEILTQSTQAGILTADMARHLTQFLEGTIQRTIERPAHGR